MSESSSILKRNKLFKIYGFGIAAFTGIFSVITVVSLIVINMNMS